MAGKVEKIGPFGDDHYEFLIDGYLVPSIKAWIDPDHEERWSVSHESRFGINVGQDDLNQWVWFVAEAMASAAGFTSFGANSRPKNPYCFQAHLITGVETATPKTGRQG